MWGSSSADMSYMHTAHGKLKLGPRLRTQHNATSTAQQFHLINAGAVGTFVSVDPVHPDAYSLNQHLQHGERQSTWRACFSPRLSHRQQNAQAPRAPFATNCLPAQPIRRPKGKHATSIPKSHITSITNTFALIQGGGKNPHPSDLQHSLITDPIALNSGWENRFHDEKLPWNGLHVRRIKDAKGKIATYGDDGFATMLENKLDHTTKIEIMKNDLRRQKANRIHATTLLRKVELMQGSPRRLETLPLQMPQLPTVYSRICEAEGVPGWVITPAPYL